MNPKTGKYDMKVGMASDKFKQSIRGKAKELTQNKGILRSR